VRRTAADKPAADYPPAKALLTGPSITIRPVKDVPTPAERALADRLQQARDDVEVVQAQLEVKRAQLLAAEVDLRQATGQYQRLKELYQTGALDARAFAKAKADVESLDAQVRVKQAELREPEIR